ncbi:MAG TPA: hypothetical protein VEK12_02980 [Alphaproteobacteria bacterium]|nr:hypothetical protein [Alphaproteobacteria bacterium]
MTGRTIPPFDVPAVCRKQAGAAFDGGLLSPDGAAVPPSRRVEKIEDGSADADRVLLDHRMCRARDYSLTSWPCASDRHLAATRPCHG